MNIDIDFSKGKKKNASGNGTGSGINNGKPDAVSGQRSDSSPITPDTKMSVSGILHREGSKCVCVTMEDADRFIEIRMPDAEILSRKGYSEKEAEEIISYLNENIDDILNAARGVNPMTAFMK